MKLLPLVLFAAILYAQPDCNPPSQAFNGGNGNFVFDNRSAGCDSWTVYYGADTGLSGYTVAFQSTNGNTAPGGWTAFAGNTTNSSTNFGTAALGLATFSNLGSSVMSGVTVNTQWVQVSVTGAGGAGVLRIAFYGYRTGNSGGGGGGGGGSGCPGTTGTPCVVTGLAAPGSTSGSPVPIALRDDSGKVTAANAFPQQADISISAASASKIVAGSSGKKIYVEHLSVAIGSGTTITIAEGTTTSTPCDTSTTTLAGPYQNATALALDWDPAGPLYTVNAADDLCLLLGGSSTGGGAITYSQR